MRMGVFDSAPAYKPSLPAKKKKGGWTSYAQLAILRKNAKTLADEKKILAEENIFLRAQVEHLTAATQRLQQKNKELLLELTIQKILEKVLTRADS
jgi:hypothetical protein